MSDQDVIALIEWGLRETMRRRPDADLPKLKPEMSLAQLGIDSIEFIEAFSYVEEELGHMLPSDRLTSARTIGDLVALVQSEVCGQAAE